MTIVAFRADATAESGSGHLMRCLALAAELTSRQVECHFVARISAEKLRDSVARAGHVLHLIPSDANDQQATLNYIARLHMRPRWLVTDHYRIDARWEAPFRTHVEGILAIDDLADRAHDCDVLLDQNLFSDMESRYTGRVQPSAKLLLGPSYAMLRPEFRSLREQVRPKSGRVERIFVSFGGVDPYNLTGRALEAIGRVGLRHVDVVIGVQHPNRTEIESLCARHIYRCHVQTDRIASLMAGSDLALGAGGSTSWERCCLALPTICVSFAENQQYIAEALHNAGACLYLGDHCQANVAAFEGAITSLSRAPGDLREMAARAAALVDGCGAQRVVDAMWKRG